MHFEAKMGKNQMKVRYDQDSDILYLLIKEGDIENTIEVSLEYSGNRVMEGKKKLVRRNIEIFEQNNRIGHKGKIGNSLVLEG